VRVEIKKASMIFDAKLLIISSNYDPRTLALAYGTDAYEPMYNKFANSCVGITHL